MRSFYLRIAIRLGLADLGVAFDLGRAAFAESVEVAFFIGDLLNRQGVEPDAHFLEIAGGLGQQFLCKTLAVVVDLFDGQRAEDRTEMAL